MLLFFLYGLAEKNAILIKAIVNDVGLDTVLSVQGFSLPCV